VELVSDALTASAQNLSLPAVQDMVSFNLDQLISVVPGDMKVPSLSALLHTITILLLGAHRGG
jgi:hypothetical protein